jgi:hypothetical protein
MDKKTGYLKCGEKDCNIQFLENDIAYFCDDCNNYYCFSCYCKIHFENHCDWVAYKVENGKFKPLSLEKVIENL